MLEGKWCHERELNSRPHPYQGCALPLSYRGACSRRAPIGACAPLVKLSLKPGLNESSTSGKAFHMSEHTNSETTREERLAAKLRENLRRRKAQVREMKNESAENSLSKGGHES